MDLRTRQTSKALRCLQNEAPEGLRQSRFLALSWWITSLHVGGRVLNIRPYSHAMLSLVKHIPPWLPFASTQRDAATSRAEMKRLLMDPVEAVQQHLVRDRASYPAVEAN